MDLEANNLLPPLQSAYRRNHSTETALLKVLSDSFLAADEGSVTLLGLLDLSAAFDTVDHEILLHRLRHSFGISEKVLAWITSFLNGRTQQVEYHGIKSAMGVLVSGVPQGSVLGPLLFSLYTTDLFTIIKDCGMNAHCYADDTQTYISTPAKNAASARKIFVDCVACVEQWMNSNRLKLNADKTQIIWLGTRQQLSKVSSEDFVLGTSFNYSISPSDSVNNLGFIFDSNMNFSKQIINSCKLCFFQLRQLRSIRRSLTTEATALIVHAFINSRLDYCNSLLYGISDCLLNKLQRVQNAAARLIANKRKYDHITPVLRDTLHWLPIPQRIDYKLSMLVFKGLNGMGPQYLSELLVPVSSVTGRQQLRSAQKCDLVVPRTRCSTLGSRAFAVCGPTVWNSIPRDIRIQSKSVHEFGKKLKTHLFKLAYGI